MNEYEYISIRYKYLSLKRLENRLIALYNATFGDIELVKYDLYTKKLYYKDILSFMNDKGYNYLEAKSKASSNYYQNLEKMDELKEINEVSLKFVERFNSLFEVKDEAKLSDIISSEIKDYSDDVKQISLDMIENYLTDYPISVEHLKDEALYQYDEKYIEEKVKYFKAEIEKLNKSFPLSALEMLSSKDGLVQIKNRINNEIEELKKENEELSKEVELSIPLDGKDVQYEN